MESLIPEAASLEVETPAEGLTAFGGGLAVLSTILGGGIVGLPFAIFMLGLPLGIALNVVVVYLSYESGMMYMALRNILPNKPDSLYEIGFELLGRRAIFLNAFVNFVMSTGLMLIYLIVISATLAQATGNFFGLAVGDAWFCSRPLFVLLIGLGLTFVIFKKEIAHFDWLSKLLFTSIFIFVVFSFVLLFLDPRFSRPTSSDGLNDAEIFENSQPHQVLVSVCTIMVAYGY